MSSKGLEIDEDLGFQRRSWAVERAGWGLIALALAAAVAGLLGPGPASKREASAADGSLHVDYHRYERHAAPATLRLRFAPSAVSDGVVRLRVSHEFLRKWRLERVEPEPARVESGPDAMTYVFRPREAASESVVLLHVEGEGIGPTAAELSVEGRAPVRLETFLYP